MLFSQNGWPASSSQEEIGLVPLTVGGVSFGLVRGGKVHEVLSYVANEVHKRVERANGTYGCWAYNFRPNVNSPGEWSNHASGTAIDFNATLHPNGSPTVENWTQAQIDEIHAILAEVGGVVRWGGDYENTPDAMHFEVNVPPEQLGEDFVVPPSGAIWPIGYSGFWNDGEYNDPTLIDRLPRLTSMSVSYPTLARYVEDGTAYWVFTATQAGRISIDALLSHYLDPTMDSGGDGVLYGPDVSLRIDRLTWNVSWQEWSTSYEGGGSNFYGSTVFPQYQHRNQGRVVLETEEGATYLISTDAEQSFPWIRMVVRIGEYAPVDPWIQPPDQTHVYARTDGNIQPQASPDTPPSYTSYLQLNFGNNPLQKGPGFEGSVDYSRTFGGPAPGDDPAAIECAWSWGRRLHLGGFLWWDDVADPGGPGSLGNGYGWAGGPGVCVVLGAGDYDSNQGFYDLPVGCDWVSTTWSFGYQDIWWRVFASSTYFNIRTALTYLRRNGVGSTQDYAPPSRGYTRAPLYLDDPDVIGDPITSFDQLVWEAPSYTTFPEVVDIEYAFDEGPQTLGGGAGVNVKWYLGAYDDTTAGWGPRANGWIGNPSGPESWVGTQHHLGDSAGGFSSWRQLPAEFMPTVSEDGTTVTPTETLRFAALPEMMFSDAPPFITTGTGINIWKARSYQYTAIKLTVRPSRIKVIRDPGIQEIDWAGETAITLTPRDQGRVFY